MELLWYLEQQQGPHGLCTLCGLRAVGCGLRAVLRDRSESLCLRRTPKLVIWYTE